MTDSYVGSFKPKGTSNWRKVRQWRGLLRIEDDKIVFIYENRNILEIKYEDIIPIKKVKAGGVIIILKDKREFLFYPRVGTNWIGFGTVEGNLDRMNRQSRVVKEVSNILNYLTNK